MINKGPFLHQSCDSCGSYLLDRIGSEYYCQTCNSMNRNFQQELRVVPAKYESNCKNKRELENQRKLNALIREFTDKYRDIASPEEMGVFRERLRAVKKLTPKKKGSREAAGVVVYYSMHDEIKLNCKEFCKKNNLSIKIFNQKYKIYHKLFKNAEIGEAAQNQIKEVEEGNVKIEEKIEESNTTEKSEYEEEPVSEVEEEEGASNGLQNVKHAIEVIFEDLFVKYFYKEQKTLIIKGLMKKLQGISKKVLLLAKYYENPPLKLYYLIFTVIKSLGHKINYQQYSQIIQKKTGYLLKRKTATEIKKIYEKFTSEESGSVSKTRGSEVKIEANHCSSRKQSDVEDIALPFISFIE